MFAASTKKPKKLPKSIESNLEALRSMPSGIANSMVNDLAKPMTTDFFNQMFGLEQAAGNVSGELKAGQSLDLSAHNNPVTPTYEDYDTQESKPAQHIQSGYEYFGHFNNINERKLARNDEQQRSMQIEQILVEIRNLANATQELEVQFKQVSMEQTPVESGTYHENFFEWVFSLLKKARERIEESQTWLQTFQSKKSQKQYWSMFKKHGTSFGLSNERVVSTQTG